MIYLTIKKLILVFRVKYLKLYLNDEERVSIQIFEREKRSVISQFKDEERFLEFSEMIINLNAKKFISFNTKYYPQAYVSKLLINLPRGFLVINSKFITKLIEEINDPNGILILLNHLKTKISRDMMNNLIKKSIISTNIKKIVLDRL